MSPRQIQHDDFILGLLANDDEQGIKILFDQYYSLLYETVSHAIQQPQDADDIVQSLFIYIWNNRHRIRIKKPVRRYLLKSALNRMRNFLRDSRRQKRMLDLSTSNGEMYTVAETADADSGIILNEMSELFETAIRNMTPRVRATYVLSRKHDMSYAEIASALGITRHTVARNIVEALKVMRTVLKPYTKIMILMGVNIWV